jgi:hypothetical protein
MLIAQRTTSLRPLSMAPEREMFSQQSKNPVCEQLSARAAEAARGSILQRSISEAQILLIIVAPPLLRAVSIGGGILSG